jgi:hypothetical protein
MRDNTLNIIMKGDKVAIKTDDGWKSAAEILADDSDQGGGPPSPERIGAMMAGNFKSPTAQATDLADKLQNVQKTDDGYSADLTPDAAKQLLTFRPRRATTNPDSNNFPQPDISDAKATIKFWIKDDVVSKVEIHVTGTVSFNGNDRDVDRTTTTEIKDVGTTTIDVPDEAKAKLGA